MFSPGHCGHVPRGAFESDWVCIRMKKCLEHVPSGMFNLEGRINGGHGHYLQAPTAEKCKGQCPSPVLWGTEQRAADDISGKQISTMNKKELSND